MNLWLRRSKKTPEGGKYLGVYEGRSSPLRPPPSWPRGFRLGTGVPGGVALGVGGRGRINEKRSRGVYPAASFFIYSSVSFSLAFILSKTIS